MDNPVFRSIALIEERIQEKLTVAALADSIHLSKYHYQRIFREAVGDSVMRYVARRRITLAAEELAARPDVTILEIALRYGYDSHEGFTRSFRAHMGITPAEYRRYHGAVSSPILPKERRIMMYSKTTDEMLRELNALIVQAQETADCARAGRMTEAQCEAGYESYWEHMAQRTDAVAQGLAETLRRITAIAQQPDAISARFVLIKAVEDAAFWFNVMAFEAGLMAARAKADHRAAFAPICGLYEQLAQSARIKTEKIVEFFAELSALIFADMRTTADEHIRKTLERANAVSSDNASPYIAEEITDIMKALSELPLEQITLRVLEDALFRLNIAAFAADADALRCPSYRALADDIAALKSQLTETIAFFQSLSCDVLQRGAEQEDSARAVSKKCADRCFQAGILRFYLKGEVQKLDDAHLLDEGQRSAFDRICKELAGTIRLADHAASGTDAVQINRNLGRIYEELTAAGKALGVYAGPVTYIARTLENMLE